MDEDRDVLVKALSSFALYRPSLHSANQLRRTDYISLKQSHKDLLPDYLHKLELVDDAIDLNASFVEAVLMSGSEALLGQPWTTDLRTTPMSGDLEKARATVKQAVRDWSVEGQRERELTYTPLLHALQREYASLGVEERKEISVLTPGCGLARLSFEIARLGFNSVGNEFSYHMLAASNHLLNHTESIGQYEIAPFVHSFSNHFSDKDMLRRVDVPDIVPSETLKDASFSMATGEFVESFGGADSTSTFECIVTCFFIDTAHNVVEYIETVRNLLKDRGLWINLGPSLWHHEHGQDRHGHSAFDEEGRFVGSIELSTGDVMSLIEKMGFVIEQQDRVSTPYMGNAKGMLEHIYHAQLFTARLHKT